VKYTLQFTEAELSVIRNALGELKLRVAAPVMGSLMQQVMAQRQAEAAPELPLPKQNGHAEQPAAH
jgi:hypothetical protein